MHLDLRGHPLHTRALSLTLVQRADGRLDAHASLLDLRKRGFVPVGGELQPSGIVHHMLLDAVVDPGTARLESIVSTQPSVAFEQSAATRGESCRDLAWRVQTLAGATLDDTFAKRVGVEIGGPRGCSHVLTAAHFLGAAAAWALAQDRAMHGDAPGRSPGQRIFRRDLIVDGAELAPGQAALAVQMTDLAFAPVTGAVQRAMDAFGAELEVRCRADVDLARFAFTGIEAGQRRRTLADLEDAVWEDRTGSVAGLVGLGLHRGVSAALFSRLTRPDDRPLLDALLMVPPALIQVVAALSERWPALAKENGWFIGTAGFPDSCYMWRKDGALLGSRVPNDPPLGAPG
jgi:hypothetical protein